MKKNLFITLLGIFILMFLISVGMIVHYYSDSAKQGELYEELAEVVEETTESEETGDEASDEENGILPEYAQAFAQNDDLVGWIRIDGTKLNYPVMQSVDSPNYYLYYLKHGFDKSYTAYGCPYIQENCNVTAPSDNLIIYGHHMNDGSMFAVLDKYKKESFWEEHKTVHFDTLTERNEYEIVAVFKTTVYTDSSESFKYYQFTDAENEDEFNSYIETCKELSLYDTGVTAEYGDKLITLSTCEYSQTNGRIVVVAKQMK